MNHRAGYSNFPMLSRFACTLWPELRYLLDTNEYRRIYFYKLLSSRQCTFYRAHANLESD
jgi:hypothetical protein